MMKNKPLQSKSYRFFERYALAEHHNRLFQKTLVVMGALCLLETFGLLFFLLKPQPIYYVPGAVMKGFAYPHQIPKESVGAFAAMWLLGWINYTPETTHNVFERSAKYMAPEFLSKSKAVFLQEMQRVQQDRISSVFAMNKEPIVQKEKNIFVVYLEGQRGVYMGKEEILLESLMYAISITMTPESESNPFGLMVVDLKTIKRKNDDF